jgi:hypothetical protein
MREHNRQPPARRRQGQYMVKQERKAAQARFLETFASTGIVLTGCRAAGVARQTVDYWLKHDQEFAERYGLARREADDRLRAEIYRRGVQGTNRRKTVTGADGRIERIEEVTEVSDTLLIFLAKARMPEFRDKVPEGATASLIQIIRGGPDLGIGAGPEPEEEELPPGRGSDGPA